MRGVVCGVLTATQSSGTRSAVVCQVVKCDLCVCVYVCVCACVLLLFVVRRGRVRVCAADRQGADETEAIEEGETALRGLGGGLWVVCSVRLCVRVAVGASEALFWVGCVA